MFRDLGQRQYDGIVQPPGWKDGRGLITHEIPKQRFVRLLLAALCVAAIVQSAMWAGGSTDNMTRRIEWKKTKLSSEGYESVGVFDVNNDGKPDIVCGGVVV